MGNRRRKRIDRRAEEGHKTLDLRQIGGSSGNRGSRHDKRTLKHTRV